MTTTIAGGRIAGRIAITCSATVALNIGDPVRLTADYTVAKCDGTGPCIGIVTVPNVARGTGALAGTFPQSQIPGDVTVEVRGDMVQTLTAGGTINANQWVSSNASGLYVAGAVGDTARVGLALTSAVAGGSIDVLVI